MRTIRDHCKPAHSALLAFSAGLALLVCQGAVAEEIIQESSDGIAAEDGSHNSPLATIGPKPEPITPPTSDEVRASIHRGVDYLLESQLESGAWGSHSSQKYYVIYAPIPGSHHAFRMAVTALAVEALIDAREAGGSGRTEAIDQAIDRAQAWLLEHANDLRRAEPDAYEQQFGYALYNVWGHAYAIHALVRLHERAQGDADLQSELKKRVEYQVDMLRRCACINGGWCYYDELARTQRPSGSPISFTTATALISLKKAESIGVEIPKKTIDEAITSINRQRYPDFAYAYGEYLRMHPRMDINRPAGSLGRSQVCNLALRMFGDSKVTDNVIKTWLDRLIARNGWLSIARKTQRPHESHFAVAGYFYYYGHYYAAMCVDELPENERAFYQDQLANVLIPLQEKDGSWWDFMLYNYHQQYGTAMTVSTLVRCLHDPVETGDPTKAAVVADGG